MKKLPIILLISGMLSSVLYIATDIITGLIYPGYSFFEHTVSELSAIGTPTRPYWIAMTFVVNPLLLLFGLSVFKISQKNRALRATSFLLMIWGFLGFFWLLFPMHQRGQIGSDSDTMHLVMAAISVIILTTLVLVGAFTQGWKFRIYSFLTILTMMFFGILTSQQTSRVAENLPTPWMGITERICSYAPLIWVIVLSIILYRSKNTRYQI